MQKILNQYDYQLPENLIAQRPASPRDSARLLVWRRAGNKINYDVFRNISNYLPKNAVLVFNQTRVIPARLEMFKQTGGKVEILFLGYDAQRKIIKVLSNRKLQIHQRISLCDGRRKVIWFDVVKKHHGCYFLKADASVNVRKLFQKHGLTPLPPYLKKSKLDETARRKEYQTVYAAKGESVAAPTAGLHFTRRLMHKLKEQGIALKFVNLDVNLGTFAPLKKENLMQNKLHAENYKIDKQTARFILKAKKQGRPIIAVGTTVIRTLESALKNPNSIKCEGTTNIFIRPPYKFKIVDGLITNFHVPQSSLMMLVAALISRKKLLAVYQQAIQKRFRFFSFGDGMLIL